VSNSLEAIASRGKPVADIEQGYMSATACILANHSMTLGRSLHWDHAKGVVVGDVYLDRVKEFVPAGENPVYPDVLMVAATVQAAVRRAKSVLAEEEKRLHEAWQNAGTIAAAIRLVLESGEQPLWTEVKDALGEKPAKDWFFKAENESVYFDIERLDAMSEEALFAKATEQ